MVRDLQRVEHKYQSRGVGVVYVGDLFVHVPALIEDSMLKTDRARRMIIGLIEIFCHKMGLDLTVEVDDEEKPFFITQRFKKLENFPVPLKWAGSQVMVKRFDLKIFIADHTDKSAQKMKDRETMNLKHMD